MFFQAPGSSFLQTPGFDPSELDTRKLHPPTPFFDLQKNPFFIWQQSTHSICGVSSSPSLIGRYLYVLQQLGTLCTTFETHVAPTPTSKRALFPWHWPITKHNSTLALTRRLVKRRCIKSPVFSSTANHVPRSLADVKGEGVFIWVTSTSTADCNSNCNFFDVDCKLFSYQASIKGFVVNCQKSCSQLQISRSISICLFTFSFVVEVWKMFVLTFAVNFKQRILILLLDVEFCS